MSDNIINELRIEADRNIRIILEDFSHLNPAQLNYSSHIHRCSIIEILIHLKNVNYRHLGRLQSVTTVNYIKGTYKINAGYFGKFYLQRVMRQNCRKQPFSREDALNIFNILKSQHQKLNELIFNFSAMEINLKLIGIAFFGILNLSIREYFEHILQCQRQHIIQARRILMIQ